MDNVSLGYDDRAEHLHLHLLFDMLDRYDIQAKLAQALSDYQNLLKPQKDK
jgi:hypothetical protein